MGRMSQDRQWQCLNSFSQHSVLGSVHTLNVVINTMCHFTVCLPAMPSERGPVF